MLTLEPTVKSAWGISSFINQTIFSILLFFAEIILRSFDLLPFPIGSISGAMFFIGLIYTFIVPSLRYRTTRFDVQNDDLVIEHGILTRVRTVIPYRRIQHTDVVQGVVERFFGLARLIVYTAGTRTAATIIPGLSLIYAEDLRNHLRLYAVEGDEV